MLLRFVATAKENGRPSNGSLRPTFRGPGSERRGGAVRCGATLVLVTRLLFVAHHPPTSSPSSIRKDEKPIHPSIHPFVPPSLPRPIYPCLPRTSTNYLTLGSLLGTYCTHKILPSHCYDISHSTPQSTFYRVFGRVYGDDLDWPETLLPQLVVLHLFTWLACVYSRSR